MQHIQEILNAKRLNKEKILTSPVTISIKYDGTALQYSDGKFYKRPYKPSAVLPEKVLTNYDLILNDYYNDALMHLKKNIAVCDKYDVVNFEVFSKSQAHTIDYSDTEFKNGTILLSAYLNGHEIDDEELKDLADKLDISCVQQLVVNQPLESIGITYNMLMDNKDSLESLFEIFYHRLNNISKDEIDRDALEGFVLTIYDEDSDQIRKYKVNNPDFMAALYKNRENDKDSLDSYAFPNLCQQFVNDIEECFNYEGEKEDNVDSRLIMLDTFSTDEYRDTLIEMYQKDLKMRDISEFPSTLNVDFIKENYSELKNLINALDKYPQWKPIVNIFLYIFKRVHKHETFNVGFDLTLKVNSIIEKYF